MLVIGCAVVALSVGQTNPMLRDVLIKFGNDDQVEARAAQRGERVESGQARRVTLLRQIVTEYGWPGFKLVGRDASRAAWLIAQHADEYPALQREWLALLQAALAKGDVDPIDVAYLEDRIAAREGRPQRWGTQGSAAALYSPEELAAVEARRKAIGLPPLIKR